MAKYGNEYYLQLSRILFNEPYSRLPISAKWLYVTLKELEHRFTGADRDSFWRTNDQLAKDMGVSINTLKRAKALLLETDLLESQQAHFMDSETGKLSEKHVTVYRILK